MGAAGPLARSAAKPTRPPPLEDCVTSIDGVPSPFSRAAAPPFTTGFASFSTPTTGLFDSGVAETLRAFSDGCLLATDAGAFTEIAVFGPGKVVCFAGEIDGEEAFVGLGTTLGGIKGCGFAIESLGTSGAVFAELED